MGFLRKNLVSLVLFGVLTSFAIQTYVGEHGLQARSALNARIGGLNKKLQLLHEKRRDLEHMTKLLAPGAVDRDMLEFQARKQLNFVYDNEHIYIRKSQQFSQ
jgi:cell division protein FtsB